MYSFLLINELLRSSLHIFVFHCFSKPIFLFVHLLIELMLLFFWFFLLGYFSSDNLDLLPFRVYFIMFFFV